LRMRVRPLPVPALRPAPLRFPPCVGFFFIVSTLVCLRMSPQSSNPSKPNRPE
jgi:hypothetical protein